MVEYALVEDTTGWAKRDDSPDATAIEYALVEDTTGWSKRDDSPDATAIEYALVEDTTGWAKREDSPDATMVEYALEISPDSEQIKRFQVRNNGVIHAQRVAEPDSKWTKRNAARRNRLTKRPTAVEYALDTEKPDASMVERARNA